jgi:methyl-accepting chemotaxis protein
MKRLKDIKIGWRIRIIIGITFVAILIANGIILSKVLRTKIIDDMYATMASEVTNLKEIIEVQVKSNQEKVNIAIELAHEYFYNLGDLKESNQTLEIKATNQITKDTKTVKVKKWVINEQEIHFNTSIVDAIQEKSVETATIFQKIDEGYLRISTNVMKLDGERATGTFIPNSSPVIKTVERGETFKGRAFVVNDWYLTAYEPIFINGEIKGILYVGVKEAKMEHVAKLFNSKTYYDDGYPYVFKSDGTITIHPKSVGLNISEYSFYKDMIEGGNKGMVYYEWEGRMKYGFYEYSEIIDSYIATSFYEDNMLSILKRIGIIIIGITIAGAIIFLIINGQIAKSITKSLRKGIEIAKKVAEGDLESKIIVDREDEVGELLQTLKTLNYNLKEVSEKATTIANGDLTVEIQKRSDKDELMDSLGRMTEKLQEVIGAVITSAQNVSSAGEEMSSSAQEVSQGASEQASSTEEVSSSMEQMASNIQQNTDNAMQTEKISAKAAVDIDEGSKNVEQTLEAMRLIAEKVSIIGDIAFQTNILALNAAVEAARAGEHGKGFAVVAAEVRKLAENSQSAAAEIDELTRSSVTVAEKSGELLRDIVPDIQKTSRLVQEITAASTEQSSGAEQINNAINQLNEITQQNAAASEQMATASTELSSQAEQLLKMVSFFKINNKNLSLDNNYSNKSEKKINNKNKALSEKILSKNEDSKGFNIEMNDDKNKNEFEDF